MTASLSSTDSPAPEGIAFLCSPGGAIERVVAASLEGAQLRDSLQTSVDASSLEAATVFLRSIPRGGFGRSTPLRIGTRDVHCFGHCKDDVVRIVGVIDPTTAAAFAESVEGFAVVAEEIRRTQSTYELYEELARLNNELVTAQRELARTVGQLQRLNDYKDELLGMAAHDLRNPLNANAAFITFLLEDAETMNDDNLILLQRLRTNSNYMLKLVESVLDFSAIQSGHVRLQKEDTRIDELARGVVETMRIIADAKHVEVRYIASHDLPVMRIDRVKMTQALQNLVSNAVQYSPSDSVVELRANATGGGVTLEVEDHGPGIPAEEIPELFKPFTRLSTATVSRQRSVGLGLAITKRMIEAHGGTIDVRSEVGRGSTFVVQLR
jgi:signal transduction histidine kinase